MTTEDNTPLELRIFSVLVIVGSVAGIVDGVAYYFHVRGQGMGLFGPVPWNVLATYVITWPGNVLTVLWLLPWGLGVAWLTFGGGKLGPVENANESASDKCS